MPQPAERERRGDRPIDPATGDAVPFFDDGRHGDGEAADGLWGAEIPGLEEPGLITYRIAASCEGRPPVTVPREGMRPFWTIAAGLPPLPLRINEICALNTEIGRYPGRDGPRLADWIELCNAGDGPVNARDYALADSPMAPWPEDLPVDVVAPGEKRLVWAARSFDAKGSWGVHFSLSHNGEEVVLLYKGIPREVVDFPPLPANASYARVPDGDGDFVIREEPTPEGGPILPPVRAHVLGYQPLLPEPGEPVAVRVWITPEIDPEEAKLVCGLGQEEVPLVAEGSGGSTWTAVIPPLDAPGEIFFSVLVTEAGGTAHRLPEIGRYTIPVGWRPRYPLRINEVFAGSRLCPIGEAFRAAGGGDWQDLIVLEEPYGPVAPFDFVEIYNAGQGVVDLSHVRLTKDPLRRPENDIGIGEWKEMSIAPGDYLVVPFRGGDEEDTLDPSGGTILIVDRRREIVDLVAYGPAEPGISHGRMPDGGDTWTALPKPTPGLPNDASFFVRGDANGDGYVGLADAIGVLGILFLSQPADCADATDVNDNGAQELGDAIQVLLYLFAGGRPPAPPFPEPGIDETRDELGCARS